MHLVICIFSGGGPNIQNVRGRHNINNEIPVFRIESLEKNIYLKWKRDECKTFSDVDSSFIMPQYKKLVAQHQNRKTWIQH